MPLIDPTRIGNNLIVLGILFAIGFMIYQKMDKERVRETVEGLKNLFGKKEEK